MEFFGFIFEHIGKEPQELVYKLQVTTFDLFLYFIYNLVIFAKNGLHPILITVAQIDEDLTTFKEDISE